MIPKHMPYAFHERMHEGGINEICHALEDTVHLRQKTIPDYSNLTTGCQSMSGPNNKAPSLPLLVAVEESGAKERWSGVRLSAPCVSSQRSNRHHEELGEQQDRTVAPVDVSRSRKRAVCVG